MFKGRVRVPLAKTVQDSGMDGGRIIGLWILGDSLTN